MVIKAIGMNSAGEVEEYSTTASMAKGYEVNNALKHITSDDLTLVTKTVTVNGNEMLQFKSDLWNVTVIKIV